MTLLVSKGARSVDLVEFRERGPFGVFMYGESFPEGMAKLVRDLKDFKPLWTIPRVDVIEYRRPFPEFKSGQVGTFDWIVLFLVVLVFIEDNLFIKRMPTTRPPYTRDLFLHQDLKN